MNKRLNLSGKSKLTLNSPTKKSFLASLFLFISLSVFGHSVQVTYCITDAGTVRVWMEHWHGNITTFGDAEVQIIVDNGMTITNEFYPAQGAIINTTIDNLPGCKSEMVVLSQCTSRPDGRNANTQNDWAYWDFTPPACDVPLTLTVNAVSGAQSFYFDEGCGNLFPTMFTSTFVDCTEPQMTCPDDVVVSAGPDCTATVNGLDPDILFDDCTDVDDLIVSYDITGATVRSGAGLPDGIFNLGLSTVMIFAEDETGKIGDCTLTVLVQDDSPQR